VHQDFENITVYSSRSDAVFQQDWWLKIARGSAPLKKVQVLDANGRIIGSLTYIVQRNALGIPTGRIPHLSRIGGPIVSESLSEEEKTIVLVQLIKQLPKISFTFSISEQAPDARLMRQTFKCAGFECFEQLNYSQPPKAIINTLGAKVRKHIKQAHSKLDLVNIDPETFISFYRANLEEAGEQSYFPLNIAKELISAGIRRNPPQARIIAASKKRTEHPSGQPVIDAAISIVWDNERCYYWLSTRRQKSHPDAIKLLMVTAMQHAAQLGLIFDADGANTLGNRRLYRTILKMPNEEKRYIFTRTSRLSQLYEAHHSKIDKLKKLAIALAPR
jgi:hypothetical protein